MSICTHTTALKACAHSSYYGGGVFQDTPITLSCDSGKQIPIGELFRHEKVLSLDMPEDSDWSPIPNTLKSVNKYHRPGVVCIETVGGILSKVAPSQRIWTTEGTVLAEMLRAGMFIMTAELVLDRIFSVERLPYAGRYWTIESEIGNWFADQILMFDGCRPSMLV